MKTPALVGTVALASLALCAPTEAQSQALDADAIPARSMVLGPACVKKRSNYGSAVTTLDFDGDGKLDVAVGAPGQGGAYVHYREAPIPGFQPFESYRVFTANGDSPCSQNAIDFFGHSVAGGDLDGDPADELVVGAPYATVGQTRKAGSVFVYGLFTDPNIPVKLVSSHSESAWLGFSVAVGDFNGDGRMDVAAGATKGVVGSDRAGLVHVFLGPIGPSSQEIVLENPNPVPDGNFGIHLAVDDPDHDGTDDLFVSAVGNTSSFGTPQAGQVFRYPGPIDAATFVVVQDPFGNSTDAPRFGMHIHARGGFLSVGAPRKDWFQIVDAGIGLMYHAPFYVTNTLHRHPTPLDADILGFRTQIADVVGDSALDVMFVTLPSPHHPQPNDYAVLVWDGADIFSGPVEFPVIEGGGDHFAQGITAASLFPGGKEELVLGDPSWDRPNHNQNDDVGRVVIYVQQ